jgi:hypothetical protein
MKHEIHWREIVALAALIRSTPIRPVDHGDADQARARISRRSNIRAFIIRLLRFVISH